MSPAESLENPILNSPYEPPAEHFVLGPTGPTGEVSVGRRPSESFIPVPVGRRRRGGANKTDPPPEQHALDFDVTGERREVNSLINDIRARVDRWRQFGSDDLLAVRQQPVPFERVEIVGQDRSERLGHGRRVERLVLDHVDALEEPADGGERPPPGVKTLQPEPGGLSGQEKR